jgi:hypothetical protein
VEARRAAPGELRASPPRVPQSGLLARTLCSARTTTDRTSRGPPPAAPRRAALESLFSPAALLPQQGVDWRAERRFGDLVVPSSVQRRLVVRDAARYRPFFHADVLMLAPER